MRGIRGITLIALIITIIVLLILAGVTINSIVQMHMIEKTLGAVENYDISQYEETIKLAESQARIEKLEDKELDILDRVQKILEENLAFKDAIYERTHVQEKEALSITIKGHTYFVLGEKEWSFAQSKEFTYQGAVEEYLVPEDGVYQLEVWGAQGASYSNSGKGGYSKGYLLLAKHTKLYVCVGGQGFVNDNKVGGYNGGGITEGTEGYEPSRGGGATHIAFANGTLQKIGENQKKEIIIVARRRTEQMQSNKLLELHLAEMVDGLNVPHPIGDSAYLVTDNQGAEFGRGEDSHYAAGGGGFYGGYGYQWFGDANNWKGGGGGSGYLGGVQEFTHRGSVYSPSSTSGIQSGDGKAKITFVTF